jgi:ADP-ribose pyrophosphatase YjhB (NUDIX family)
VPRGRERLGAAVTHVVRFCLACGHRLSIALVEGRRRRRCRRCGWTHYNNPVPAATGVIVRRGCILLTLRARPPYAGTWDLPGGFLEPDETPDEGLHREIEEELALRVRRARLIGFATDTYGPRGFPVLSMIYRVVVAPGEPSAADDVAEARWFPVAAVPFRSIAFPSLRRALRTYLRAAGRPITGR